ncbi:MAG: METTL5 family protein [Candidatus Heimdallarchaeaceae archaeon]
MKQKDLEIFLSRLKTFQKPKVSLEQYQIPPRLAAMIVYRAYLLGEIEKKSVLDLCCGTGSFSIAAKLLGAREVFGIDIDWSAIKIANENSSKFNIYVEWVLSDVLKTNFKVDTAFMNSPFGIQGKTRDKFFLEIALRSAKTLYSIHLYNEENIKFLKRIVEKHNKQISEIFKAEFEIPKIFKFHKKRYHIINVAIIKTENKKN